MGSQLLVYQLSTGRLLLEFTAFSCGVHVHGIHAVHLPKACLLAVHGERAVKVSSEPMKHKTILSIMCKPPIDKSSCHADFHAAQNAVRLDSFRARNASDWPFCSVDHGLQAVFVPQRSFTPKQKHKSTQLWAGNACSCNAVQMHKLIMVEAEMVGNVRHPIKFAC